MTQIVAGWYPDPAGSGQVRYWDGAAWTNDLRAPTEAPSLTTRRSTLRPQPYAARPPIRPRPTRDTETSNQGSPRLFGWVLLGFGIVSLLAGLGALLPAFATTAIFGGLSSAGAGAVETTGQVVDLQSRGAECTPIATFVVDGQTYRAISRTTFSPCNTSLGWDVTVSYLPTNPSTAVIAFDDNVTGFVSGGFIAATFVFGGIGLLMIVGGIALLRRNPAATAGPLIT